MNIQDFEVVHEISRERLKYAQQMRSANTFKKEQPKPLAFLKAFIKPFNLKQLIHKKRRYRHVI